MRIEQARNTITQKVEDWRRKKEEKGYKKMEWKKASTRRFMFFYFVRLWV